LKPPVNGVEREHAFVYCQSLVVIAESTLTTALPRIRFGVVIVCAIKADTCHPPLKLRNDTLFSTLTLPIKFTTGEPPPNIVVLLPMAGFWASFSPAFTRNLQASYSKEFKRLAVHRGWKTGGPKYRKQWILCCEEEFGAQYGRNERLEGLQALCGDVGIRNIPNTITLCKKVGSACVFWL
jgi:hypothetical protein